MPSRQLRITQRLVSGPVTEGGFADLLAHSDPEQSLKTGGVLPTAGIMPVPLRQQGETGRTWRMEHLVILPLHATWPIGTVRQPVTMQMSCGACGRQGGIRHFSGSATFTMQYDGFAEGRIEDISLTSADGAKAHGHLSFWEDEPAPHLVSDQDVEFFLEIDGKSGVLAGSLATWLTEHKRVGGAFSAIPMDDASGFGGITGQFRGDGCTPPCGVEN